MPKIIPPRECKLEGCGKTFTPKRYWQSYCCQAHRLKAFYIRQAKLPLEEQLEHRAQMWWDKEYPKEIREVIEDRAEAQKALEKAKAIEAPELEDILGEDWSKPFSVEDL